MIKEYTKELIMANPFLGLAFTKKEFSMLLDERIANANLVIGLSPETILPFFLKKACEYCGVSLGYRTVYYDYASRIIAEHEYLWTEEEKDFGFPVANNHWDLYPEYDNEFEKFDTGILSLGEYFPIGIEIYEELNGIEKSYFAYAFLLFFLRYNEEREKELMEEFREEMNWMEED